MAAKTMGVGLLGLGTVGGAVAASLQAQADAYERRAGVRFTVVKALVRDPGKQRTAQLLSLPLTKDPEDVLTDPSIQIVVELMGGEEPAYTLMQRALSSGRHVVTANKEVIAKRGTQLRALAAKHGVSLRYEASVGGGIPVIATLQRDLLANDIVAVTAIINGTTNYILTRMAQEGLDFGEALAQAQALGYAEADPRNDVEGIDAAYKLAILSALAFRTEVAFEGVYHEGISRLAARDFTYANELGYTVKLLAIARRTAAGLQTRVHPAFLPHQEPLSKVDGVFNAIQIEGDLSGRVLLQGRGAGAGPTASAVIADLLEVGRSHGAAPPADIESGSAIPALPMEALKTRYYVRMSVTDQPGVLARVALIFGEERISIASVLQKEVDEHAGTAELVIMTHHAAEGDMLKALRRIGELEVVSEIGNMVRVEDQA